MIANLMMYRRPETDPALARFWDHIRAELARRGIDSPATLSQDAEEFSVWEAPDLVLSQTCGMPYRTRLHHKVTLVGTPDYALSDCPPGYYRSAFLVRRDDKRRTLPGFRDATFAFNQTISQSGYAAPYFHLRPHGFWFENRLQTGQHRDSARAVADGRADIAALDAVTWRLVEKYDPFARDLRVLEWTRPTPGLPLITANHAMADKIFDAVAAAIETLPAPHCDILGLRGLVRIAKADYLALKNP